MLKIYKVSKGAAVDFAAEELKKYLRMMIPEENDIDIDFAADASEGFRLGLFADLGMDETAEDDVFDDILYADCNESGGVIAGNNARSVLLSVYEYLRKNGLRWLYPGPDGEYIPIKAIDPVRFLYRPSCRYRGFANATAASYQTNLEIIDFLPKIGMNTFMVEFRVPVYYTDSYYSHKHNTKHRPPEKVTNETILQWKRACECEAGKRGLIFHDVGHGFCIDSFGIDSCHSWNQTDESQIPEESRKYLALVKGKRGFAGGVPVNTNFCMSNSEARSIFANYVADYAAQHKNVDVLHVWLSDGVNAHCECDECVKKTPSDWYMDLMNDIDAVMTARGLDTKIVFIAYVDILWAPEKTFIKNPDRFIFMLAPFGSNNYDGIPKGEFTKTMPPYKRNDIYLPKSIEEFMICYEDWRKNFRGPAFLFDYQLWCSHYCDPGLFSHCKKMVEFTRYYKEHGIDGCVQDGDMRAFLPNGLLFYTMARSLFDTSLSAEDIIDDYFSHAYGKNFARFKEFFGQVGGVLDYAYLSERLSSDKRVSLYYNPAFADKVEKELPAVLALGRALVEEHFTSPVRVQTVSVRLLSHYIELLEWIGRIFVKKARGDDAGAAEIYHACRDAFGQKECELERYFNHCHFFYFMDFVVFGSVSDPEFMIK